MADRLEDRIRDFLAAHLDVLEDGLRLVQTEYRLANPAGAGGRIDIVARDKFRHLVVIEVKRSDQSARQTLNEIHKYTALLRIEHGLDETQVRVLVVSTDWNELLLPLSECADAFPYSVEGFAIWTTNDGSVTKAERIRLVPKAGLIRFSREQGAYLFRTPEQRNGSLVSLVTFARAAGLTDFLILSLDYQGKNPAVCFPFALYLAFASPLFSLPPDEKRKLEELSSWDDELDDPDENFLVAVNRSFVGVPDDIEVGYPEKLTNLRKDWEITVATRAGRLEHPHSLLSDQDLLLLAQAVEGGSSIYLGKISSPKFHASWSRLRAEVTPVLRGMPDWETVVPLFLNEIQAASPNATVSVSIYNPANLVMSLYSIAWARDFSHCPHLELVVESGPDVRILLSVLIWNGSPITDPPERTITEVYGGLDEWLFACHFHGTFEWEAPALKAHRLFAPILEFRRTNDEELRPHLVEAENGRLRRTLFVPDPFRSIAEFAESHANYLSALKTFLEANTRGLPGSLEANES